MEEKEYYRKLIMDIINKIEKVDVLIYLYHFIKGKFGFTTGNNRNLNN